MTERDYEVIALHLGRLQYAFGMPDMLAERFEQAVEIIADVFDSKSTRFNRMRFYADVYGDAGRAATKVQSEDTRRSALKAYLKA